MYGKKHSEEAKKKMSEAKRKTSDKSGKLHFDYYASKISWVEEVREYPEGSNLLQVRCKQCGEWFYCSNREFNDRYFRGIDYGTQYFYCSEECKKSCSIYKKRKYTKGHELYYRPNQSKWAKEVRRRANNLCEICGANDCEAPLEAHHIEPVAIAPEKIDDPDNGVLLCNTCHKEKGHRDKGCRIKDLISK